MCGALISTYQLLITLGIFLLVSLPTIYMLIYVIVGGEDSFVGPMVGAALLTILPEVARPLQSWMPLLFAAILMAIIFLMPEGLVGLPRRLASLLGKRTKEEPDAAS